MRPAFWLVVGLFVVLVLCAADGYIAVEIARTELLQIKGMALDSAIRVGNQRRVHRN